MQIYNGTVVLQFDDSTTGNADSGALVTVREYNIASGTGNLADIFNIDNVQLTLKGIIILEPLMDCMT